MTRAMAALLGGVASTALVAQPAEPLQLNPFHDPFVQATSGRPCPTPLGPAYTETARRAESHSRIERGTSCWLAGKCAEPNAYRYDAGIARAAVTALRAVPALATSAIWVTAQRRFVYLEGCVADAAQAAKAEAMVKALPDVELVIPALALPGERIPYARLQP
ncbi:MAG TPA: BON domain-containing protein [Caldimonas sp.]|nr:BON domain-containing protein [Caldimonas sp.]